MQQAVIEAGNRAHGLQRKLNKQAHKLVLDRLFRRDSHLPTGTRRWRRGTLMGLRRSRAYVVLDDPPMEVKLYAADLSPDGAALAVDRDGVRLRIGHDGSERWLVGERIEIAAIGHDDQRNRWRFAIRTPIRSALSPPR
jgi:ribonuclease R